MTKEALAWPLYTDVELRASPSDELGRLLLESLEGMLFVAIL
jgi:hypothetical protein